MSRVLAALRESPHDDRARLVWADSVGGERGELVVVQCDLARGGLSLDEAIARRRRQRELLAAHGVEWFSEDGLADRWSFRRGFVEAAQLGAAAFMTNAQRLDEAAPLLSCLSLEGLTANQALSGQMDGDHPLETLRRLFEHGAFEKVRGLELRKVEIRTERESEMTPYTSTWLGDEAIELAAKMGALSRLRAFGVRYSGVGVRGIESLISAGVLAQMATLRFVGIGEDAARLLLSAGRLPNLQSLELGGFAGERVAALAPLIPPSVVDLRLHTITDEALHALAASPAAPTLERLVMHHHGRPRRDPRPLAKMPRLRSLRTEESAAPFNAAYTETTRWFVRELAALALPELRELYVGTTSMSEDQLRAIAWALGPQLERLDLRTGRVTPTIADELREVVAGDLFVGSWVEHDPLLSIGVTHEPAWEGTVTRGT